MTALARADTVAVTVEVDGAVVRISHNIDGTPSRGLVELDPGASGVTLDEVEVTALTSAVAMVLTQHYLPAQLITPGFAAARRAVSGLLTMLYDIRCSVDRRPYLAPPVVTGLDQSDPPDRAKSQDPRRVVVLLSGGYDSTTSCLALQAAGFDVQALHIASNTHAMPFERVAAGRVAEALGIPLATMELKLPAPRLLGRQYTVSLDEFPGSNAIPHGRDLPLMVLGAAYARRIGASMVALSHDREARERRIQVGDRMIDRHDVESSRGFRLAQDFLATSGLSDVQLFSPLAGTSIHQIRRRLLSEPGDFAAIVQSCVWTRRCEQCMKCASEYALLREAGLPTDGWTSNPYQNEDLEVFAEFFDGVSLPEDLPYGRPILMSMLLAFEQDPRLGEEYWPAAFRRLRVFQDPLAAQELRRYCSTVTFSPEVDRDVERWLARG